MLQNGYNVTARQEGIEIVVKCADMDKSIIYFRGDRMQALRSDLGWTLEDLESEARKTLGEDAVGAAQLSLIENGKRFPSLRVAVAISRSLQSSLDYLCNITEFDRTSNGEDEITIVVRSDDERAKIQSIAYKFLDLPVEDQSRIIDLITRLGSGGKSSVTLSNQERFERAFAELAEVSGFTVAKDFVNSLRPS